MSNIVEQIKQASKAAQDAETLLRTHAKTAIEETLQKTFDAKPEIQVIQWAQKDSPYNDEGLYPGVHGPVVLHEGTEGDFEVDAGYPEWAYDDTWDERLVELREVLNAVGEKVLSELYYDEYVVTASRSSSGFHIDNTYAGY